MKRPFLHSLVQRSSVYGPDFYSVIAKVDMCGHKWRADCCFNIFILGKSTRPLLRIIRFFKADSRHLAAFQVAFKNNSTPLCVFLWNPLLAWFRWLSFSFTVHWKLFHIHIRGNDRNFLPPARLVLNYSAVISFFSRRGFLKFVNTHS